MRLVPMPDALPAGVELFRLDLDLDGGLEPALPWLAPQERERAGRFLRRADRVRYAHTRAAARRLLGERIGCAAHDVPLAIGVHGKPFVDRASVPAPLFNVSHSGCHALIALADPGGVAQLGVDIEQQKPDLDPESILQLAFTAREGDGVRAAANALQALYQRWVGKEAVLKAIGVGVPGHLRSIGICPAERGGRLGVESDVAEWSCFEAMALAAPPGYAAALAWRTKGTGTT